MSNKWIFWFEEIGQKDNDLVGKKCANLGEMTKLGLQVPPGFALSVEAYKRFLSETHAIDEMRDYLRKFGSTLNMEKVSELSVTLRRAVESKGMPDEMAGVITSYYDALCRKSSTPDVAVSVRSAGLVSHPGQYETYLNVKGRLDLLVKIIKVWSSSFNPRSLSFRLHKGLPLEVGPIGVAVVKMVNARAAGVTLTADPNNGDNSRMVFEANWGLGESVVSGSVTPDIYILDKNSLDILEKRVGQKTRTVVPAERGIVEEDIPPGKASIFCLSNEEVKEIGRIARLVEKYFENIPQDIEWAIDNDLPAGKNIFLLQTRPAVIAKKTNSTEKILDLMMRRLR